MESAAKAPMATATTVSSRQGTCRTCGGADETGCGNRDSNLAQHDATPYRSTLLG
jgi:hypothetical protein